MKKERGSALIVAILIVAAIGAIAFSFGKILLLESTNASLYENGTVAYYAAESGIEEGFLRYRYDREAEVPFKNWTLGEDKIYRSNLVTDFVYTGASNNGKSRTSLISGAGDEQYDLRMGFIGSESGPFFGQDLDRNGRLDEIDLENPNYGTGDYGALTVTKDNSVKLSLGKLDLFSSSVDLKALFTPYDATVPVVPARAIVEAKITVKYAVGGETKEYTNLIVPVSSAPTVCSNLGQTTVADNAECQAGLIKAVGQPAGFTNQNYYWSVNDLITRWRTISLFAPFNTASGDKATLTLKPLYNNMKIGLVSGACASSCLTKTSRYVVPGPYTTISSTGYYGGVARTLEANIDRQSGTLYDLFDYVIYRAS